MDDEVKTGHCQNWPLPCCMKMAWPRRPAVQVSRGDPAWIARARRPERIRGYARGAAARVCCPSCVADVEGCHRGVGRPSLPRVGLYNCRRFAARVVALRRSHTGSEPHWSGWRCWLRAFADGRAASLRLATGASQLSPRTSRPAHGDWSLSVLRSACETAGVASVMSRSAGLATAPLSLH